MEINAIIKNLRDANPEAIRARLADIAAEEKALRELLRLVKRSRPKSPGRAEVRRA